MTRTGVGMGRIALLAIAAILLLTLSFGDEPAFTQTNGPIKIGIYGPLSGPLAVPGTSALRGVTLAVNRINADGGINGRQVELISYDDGAQPDQAVSVARKLVTNDQVTAAISGSISDTTRAAASIFQDAGTPMISAYATHPSITEVGDLVFRTGIRAELHGFTAAKVVSDVLDAETVAILNIDNFFGTATAQSFRDRIQELNESGEHDVEIVFDDTYSFGESEFRSQLRQINSMNPDVLYPVSFPSDAAAIVSQADELGLDARIIGQEPYDNFEFIELAREDSENGVLVTTNFDHDKPIARDFIGDYVAEFDARPDMRSASAFDAMLVLAHAIEQGGTSADGIRDALAGLQDFEAAVTGPFFRVTETRDVVRPMQVQIIENSEFRHWMTFTDEDVITPPSQ